MPVIEIEQARISFLDPFPKNDQIVLLLHGLGTEGSSWVYQINALGEVGFRPIAPDLPGFGQSEYYGKKWTIRNTAEIVKDFSSRITDKPICLAGISMGGAIALQMAINHAEKLVSLVLVNTFASLKPKRFNEWYYLLRRYIKARLYGTGSQAEMTARRIFPRDDQEEQRKELIQHIRHTNPEVYKNAMYELGLFNVRKNLSQIELPALIIIGEKDTTVPLKNQFDLVKGIRGSQQIMIPDAGHGAIIDSPFAVNNALIRFLSQHSI